MGYGGKHVERERARELRALSWTLQEIADELGVAKGSVSTWVRDVAFTPKPRNRGHVDQQPHPLHLKKIAEIERCRIEAEAAFGILTERDRDLFVLGLYAGEGAKTGSHVSMANTNPSYLRTFVAWLREEIGVDEARLRARLYLHEGLDLDAATCFWSDALDIPISQFHRPYRAPANESRRRAKHRYGCATVIYSSVSVHRRVMARIEAVASHFDFPG
jgi:transcriptional regulator with XRE-family HTH domain